MSDDLIKRLRDYGDGDYVQNHEDRIEAADRIEALTAANQELRSENARLRDTLSEVMQWLAAWEPAFLQDEEWPATALKARQALAGKDEQ